jgi:hypothetical protein
VTLRPYFSASGHRRDQTLLKELREWLKLQRNLGWLEAGTVRQELALSDPSLAMSAVASELRRADLVFVLLSMEYLNSTECIESELALALSLQEAGLLQVIIIQLRAVPIGEIPVPANGQLHDLRRWDWHPKQTGRPVDSFNLFQRAAAWRIVESEVRTRVIQIREGRTSEDLPTEEFDLYCKGEEQGLGMFLDRFTRAICAGYEAGSQQPSLRSEQLEVARKIYWDLFCAPKMIHGAYIKSQHRSFAHFLFKVAFLVGKKAVRTPTRAAYEVSRRMTAHDDGLQGKRGG